MKKFLRYFVLTVFRFGAAILLLMAYTGNLGDYGWAIAVGAVLAVTALVTFIPPVQYEDRSGTAAPEEASEQPQDA